METYVLEGTEVKKTGRTAVRKLRTGKELIQVEVMPVDPAFDWKKWVDESQLYVVQSDVK